MYLSFAVHKLAKYSSNPVKVHFEGLIHLLRYIRENKTIDVVLNEFIWTVNCLYYLNYETIDHTSSTCHLFRSRNDLGQTVSSYGWCNGVPRVVNNLVCMDGIILHQRNYY